MQSGEVERYYPELSYITCEEAGAGREDHRERVRVANGFMIEALGMDTLAREGTIDG